VDVLLKDSLFPLLFPHSGGGSLRNTFLILITKIGSLLPQTDTQDLVSLITDFEMGELDSYDTLKLFGALISTGTINHLQGYYQRTARDLVETGYLSNEGDVL